MKLLLTDAQKKRRRLTKKIIREYNRLCQPNTMKTAVIGHLSKEYSISPSTVQRIIANELAE